MNRSRTLFALSAVGALAAGAAPAQVESESGAFALFAQFERIAARDLWPGYDPRAFPLAIYDGDRTLLFGHPAPPDGFVPVEGRPGVSVWPGRHPAVTANSSASIGGVETATVMPGRPGRPIAERAGLVAHEAFHVYQRLRHPAWTANEAALFTYPVEDAELLALRRLETEALRRALRSEPSALAAGWAVAGLASRAERFAKLPDACSGYERGIELKEGLASYVEHRAVGGARNRAMPDEDFAADAVRLRGYSTGLALALLLDRFAEDWRVRLEHGDTSSLDELLGEALAGVEVDDCAFTDLERAGVRERVARDVAELRRGLAEARREFIERGGWRIVVVARSPLLPRGFDPLNVRRVGEGEVLHSRFLKLGNDAVALEILGRAAMTESAGAHPLFNGVRRVVVTGIEREPRVVERDGGIEVTAEGLEVSVRGGVVERDGDSLTIRG